MFTSFKIAINVFSGDKKPHIDNCFAVTYIYIYRSSYYGNTQNVPTSNEVSIFHKKYTGIKQINKNLIR